MIALILLAVLAASSLAQLVWTRREVQRIQTWLVDERTKLQLDSFAKVSVWAQWTWLAFLGCIGAVYFDAQRNADLNGMALSSAVACWCLVQLIVSWQSSTVCRLVIRFAAVRRLGEQGLADAADVFAAGPQSLVTREELQRKVGTLRRVALVWLAVLVTLVASALLVLLAAALENVASSAGGFLLLVAGFVLPGVIALYVVRWVVAGRAQRAQFLWFLAATTQKQRPLASELMEWGRAHPGRYGVSVTNVACDISVGETFADALEAQRGLLTPSDLMSIRVAEQTGTLPETLRECAVRQTQSLKSDSIGGSATAACLWLWALVVTAMTVVSFLIVFIAPKYKAIFSGFGTMLPGVTIFVLDVADIFARWIVLWLPLVIAVAVHTLWTCGEAFLKGWSETGLAWWTGWGRQAEIPRLLRRLRAAVLVKMPWPVALQPMVLSHPQDDVRARLERVLGRVTAGMAIWPAMRDSGLLSPRDVGLLEMAERANNLEWALAALAESKERTLSHRWQVLTTMSVPVFTLCAGLVVLVICAAFFLPIVKLLNDLS